MPVGEKFKILGRALYQNSPSHNFNKIVGKWLATDKNGNSADQMPAHRNQVLDQIETSKAWWEVLVWTLAQFKSRTLTLLGDYQTISLWGLEGSLPHTKTKVNILDWDWGSTPIKGIPRGASKIIICRQPVDARSWNAIRELKSKYKNRIVLITELLLPFTPLTLLMEKLEYHKPEFEENLPYYFGKKFFGPLEKIRNIFDIKGKKIVEFGPLDGFQTSGLLHLGAKSLDCVEARAENAVKISALKQAMGWSNLNVIMDDFHNFDSQKYGRYDLAFAHGVYYHSIQPFLFLSNLVSLSNNIFIGGFCATDDLPGSSWMTLNHGGKKYRVKRYVEWHRFTAGINSYGYFFHKEDLLRFFEERDFSVSVIDEEKMSVTAGCYLRFLARKKGQKRRRPNSQSRLADSPQSHRRQS